MIIQFDLFKVLDNLTFIILYLVVIKDIFIGGEFNFYYWFKYGKKYTEWYNNRPKFKNYLKEKENEN